jgi:FKBP-type peptidyl-prolyl cis-trans isomerase FklB
MNRMNKFSLATSLVLGLAPLVRADTTNVTSSVLSDDKARVSYAIGLNIGHNFKQQNLDVDSDLVGRAIKDVVAGNPELMTEAEVKETLTAFQKEFRAKQQARMAQLAITNKADGEAFLATNKNQPGVITLADGLQYLVLTNGSGATPAATDKVTVNYRGTLLDGTEFDSSYKRGEPASFPVGGVIPGWTEALQKMSVGSKWKLFIPAGLAYGEKGQRGIPPNSLLIFEVELISIAPATPATPAPVAVPAQPLTSDIIKVPSAEEMKKGAKIEVIKPEDAAKAQSAAQPAAK